MADLHFITSHLVSIFSFPSRSHPPFSFPFSGIYLVDVHSIQHIYSQIKIKVIAESNSITAVEYKYPGAPRLPASYPLVFAPHVKLSYFQKKESISITKMVMGNPMMILMVVTFGVVVMFPKMLGVDKDQMKELMEQQKAQGIESDPTKAFQKLFGMDSKADEDD
jgi:hypothetical protein